MRIVIVGAGLSGLAAGRALDDRGHHVTLLDKGRSPGGRLATRRIGMATVDHGAQFFTVRTPEFHRIIVPLIASGLVMVWSHGFAGVDGHPRYMVAGGMNQFAKHLAVGLDIRCNSLAFAVRPTADGAGWTVVLDDATELTADGVLLTCPLPQSYALLTTSGVELPRDLAMTEYDRTLALLAVLDRPPSIAPPGGLHQPDSTFTFVADNQAKGVSSVPAVTLHAAPGVSEEWWDRDPEEASAYLLDAGRTWLGTATVLEHQLKRWRFATPRHIWPDPCWIAPSASPLVLAGDAFAGPKIEGAFLSGTAAARAFGTD